MLLLFPLYQFAIVKQLKAAQRRLEQQQQQQKQWRQRSSTDNSWRQLLLLYADNATMYFQRKNLKSLAAKQKLLECTPQPAAPAGPAAACLEQVWRAQTSCLCVHNIMLCKQKAKKQKTDIWKTEMATGKQSHKGHGRPNTSRIYARATFMSRKWIKREREGEWREAAAWTMANKQWQCHNALEQLLGRTCSPSDFRLRMTLSTHDSWWLRLMLLLLLLLATNAKHFIKSSVHINQTRLPTAAAAWSSCSREQQQRIQWHIDLTALDNSVAQKCNQCAVVNPIKLPRLSNWWLCSPMGQNKCVPHEVAIIKRNVQRVRLLNIL